MQSALFGSRAITWLAFLAETVGNSYFLERERIARRKSAIRYTSCANARATMRYALPGRSYLIMSGAFFEFVLILILRHKEIRAVARG